MPRKLSICQSTAAYYPYPSGISENIYHLTRALRARGHDVRILTTGYDQLTDDETGITRFGRARLIPLNKSYATAPFGWNLSGQIRNYLRRNRFDVIHLHGFFPPDISYYALRHSHALNVMTFHTVGFVTSRLAAEVLSRIFAGLNRRVAARIAETRSAVDFVRPYFPGEYRIIPAGVDTTRFSPTLPPIPEFRTPFAPPRILFVGRLDARKGLPVLLRALPLVREQIPNTELIVAGRGPLESDARALAARLGLASSVHFAGFVPNDLLPRYFVSADVYCAPSLGGEAFGIVLLEAMAAGIPITASDITGYNEVVEEGRTGLLAPPGNPEALARVLIRLLNDPALRAQLSAAGRLRAQQLAWPNIAEQLEQLYLELLAERTGGS